MVDQDRINNFIQNLKFQPTSAKSTIPQEIDQLDHSALIPAILELIQTTNSIETKQVAIQSLEHLADNNSLRPLLDIILNEEDPALLRTTIKTLAYLSEESSLPVLNKLVNRSADPDLIQLASQAVQIIQGVTPKYSIAEI